METDSPARSAAMTGLAVVGFVSLVILGLWLALYLARSLSGGSSSLGAVADYVGSLFAPQSPAGLAVVPTASTTLPFEEASSTSALATTTPAVGSTTPATTTPKKAAQGPAPIYYKTVTTTYPVPGATQIPVSNATNLTGLPDLLVKVTDVGYVDSNGTFVPATTISRSDELAAEILVTNVGTNVSGPWDIKVAVPTSFDANFTETQTMDSLSPSQSTVIDLRLTHGLPRKGTNSITATVDPDNKIAESNESNNSDSASITAN